MQRAASDEGRQSVDIARLALGRARLMAGFLSVARLARLIGLGVAWHERLRGRRNVGLRLARSERCFGERMAVVLAVLEIVVAARLELLIVAAAVRARLEVRIVLPELFLRRRDQAEIMLGVLEIVLGRDRVARRLRVTGKLEIFLRHMIGRAADFHVRPAIAGPAAQVISTVQGLSDLSYHNFAKRFCESRRACAVIRAASASASATRPAAVFSTPSSL